MNSIRHRLRFFVTDAWDELRHSPGVNLLAVGTLVAVLYGTGLIALVLSNVGEFVATLREDVRVEVYLAEGASPERREELDAALNATAGVTRVDYIDRRAALERYRAWAGDMAGLVDELEANPLPESFEVFLAPGAGAEDVGAKIQAEFGGADGVEQVRFDRELLGRIEALLNLARFGGGGLGLLVLAAVIFVMASVLRLAVYARRDEIEIMLLVGATPAFVRGPFLVAGLVQGLVSSAAAMALIELTRRTARGYASAESLGLLDLFLKNPLPERLVLGLFLIGTTVSCTAAWFAVRRRV